MNEKIFADMHAASLQELCLQALLHICSHASLQSCFCLHVIGLNTSLCLHKLTHF